MTSYWDEKEQMIYEGMDIVKVEAGVIRDVNLVAGDIDTPEEIREQLMKIIALNQHTFMIGDEDHGSAKAKRSYQMSKHSRLLSLLHSAFHEIGRKEIKYRYCVLRDNPQRFLNSRNAWVKKKYGED